MYPFIDHYIVSSSEKNNKASHTIQRILSALKNDIIATGIKWKTTWKMSILNVYFTGLL